MFSIIRFKQVAVNFLCQPFFFFPLILIVPSLPLFSLPPLQRRWWPGGKWCRDRYLTLRWRRAPCPAWARWQASQPPRSPINSSWLISISWAPCCPRCISWGDWGRGRWPSRQRWAESWLQVKLSASVCIKGLFMVQVEFCPLWCIQELGKRLPNSFFFQGCHYCCRSIRFSSYKMWSCNAWFSCLQHIMFSDGWRWGKEETKTREKQGSSSTMPKQKEGTDWLPSKGEFMTQHCILMSRGRAAQGGS